MADTDALGLWAIAEADPDFLAVVDPEHNQLTFAELAALTNRVSRGLRVAGLGRGDQVTTFLPNCFEQLAVCLAAYQSGLYVTTINWHFVGAEINYIVNDAETKAFIVHERFGKRPPRPSTAVSRPRRTGSAWAARSRASDPSTS